MPGRGARGGSKVRGKMKNIDRRLQRLEQWVCSQRNDGGETPVEVLCARIRRLAEASGEIYEPPPTGPFTNDRGRPFSVAEILRGRGSSQNVSEM